jgi:hypothetical protein
MEELVVSGDINVVQNYDELTEGMNDSGVVQIYPETQAGTSADSSTHVATLAGSGDPYIQEDITIHLDYYCKRRSELKEDMSAVVAGIDAIRSKIKEQLCPPFGIGDCRSFQWSWTRVTFVYGGDEVNFAGARFVLVLRVF